MREAKCKTCKKVFEAPPKGPLPPNCPKHRFLSVCKSCSKSFNGTFRIEVLCPKCRTSEKPCAECGNGFSPSPKGKVSPLCAACRKRKQIKQSVQFNKKRTLEVNPIKPCVDCGGVVPLLKTKRYVRCESCMEALPKFTFLLCEDFSHAFKGICRLSAWFSLSQHLFRSFTSKYEG